MKINHITKDIILQAQRGNRDAFEKLYKTFYKEVFSVARYTLGNDTQAEDVLQETFLKVYCKLSELQTPEAFSSWLYRITQNECRMSMRKKDEKLLFYDTQSEDFSSIVDIEPEVPEFDFETAEDRNLVKREVENLPIQYRTVIVYFYYLNLSIKEIAELLSCKESTVKSRLFTGRTMLKKSLLIAQKNLGYQLALSLIPMSRLLDIGLLERSPSDKAAALILSSILTRLASAGTIIGRILLFFRGIRKRLTRSGRSMAIAAVAAVIILLSVGLLYAEANGRFDILNSLSAGRQSSLTDSSADAYSDVLNTAKSQETLSSESPSPVTTSHTPDTKNHIQAAKESSDSSASSGLSSPSAASTPDPALVSTCPATTVPDITPTPVPSQNPAPIPTMTTAPTPSPTIMPTTMPTPTVMPTMTPTPTPLLSPSPSATPYPTGTPSPSPYYYTDMSDEAMTGWTAGSGSGSISVENKTLVVLGSPSYLVYNENTNSTDAELVTTIIPGSANCRIGIVFRFTDASNYAVIGYNNGDWFWQNGTGGSGSILSAGPQLTKDVPALIRLSYVGSTISLSVNGISCFTEELPDLPVDEGKVGFFAMNGGKFSVDDLAVYTE